MGIFLSCVACSFYRNGTEFFAKTCTQIVMLNPAYLFHKKYLTFYIICFRGKRRREKKMRPARKQIFVVNFLGGDDLLAVNSTTFIVARFPPFFPHQSFPTAKEPCES